MAKPPKGLASLPGAKNTGPVKPDYVPEETWEAANDEQKAYLVDPAHMEEIKEAYGTDEPSKEEKTDEGEKVSVAISGGLPTSLETETNDLAAKVTEKDRETFVAAVEAELNAKVLSVALILAVEKVYGKGAQSLPLFGTTAKDSNNPDIRMIHKKNPSTGKYAKDESEISSLEIVALKAMVPPGLQSELKDLESDAAAKRAKETPVPIGTLTRISELRERRNKLITKFVNSVRLSQQLNAIGEMPLVGWSFISTKGDRDVKDDMSNLTVATACVMLYPKDKSGNMSGVPMAVSPASVLEYRVSVALENGGTLEALDKSPAPANPKGTGGDEELKFDDFDQATRGLLSELTFWNKYLGDNTSDKDLKTIRAHLLSENGANTLAYIFKLTEMFEDTVTSNNEYRAQYGRYTSRANRAQGGEANRQVKDQQDGAKAA